MNPQRKSEGTIKKLRNVFYFTSVSDLKKQVCSSLKVPSDFDVTQFELGYYEPGHGKKRWLTDTEDIDEMKKVYIKKKEVLLWCYDPSITPTKKRSSTRRQIDCDDSAESTPKLKSRSRFENALENKMSKVEEVYETLQKKHSKIYKPEQLRAWANMVQMQKHTSLEEPHSGRFFKTQKSTKQEATPETSVTTECKASIASLSPVERLTLHTQCIEQLERWHGLMEKGAISQEQYTDIQAKVLDEMKNY